MRERYARGLFAALIILASVALAAPPADAAAVRTGIQSFVPQTLAANDDGSTAAVPIGFTVNFFGIVRTSLFVNNNGNVTFDRSLGTFTPFDLTSTATQIIAPFFADVDTRGVGSGLTQYGNGLVNGRLSFIVNWINVGYFGSHVDKLNSFQLIIVDRSDTGAGNFDFEFNYDRIQWETGDASGGINGLGGSSARAGFSNGTGVQGTFFELPGSAVNGAFLDGATTSLVRNSLASVVPGRYLFQARNGILAQGETEIIIGQVSTGFLGELPNGPSEDPRISGNSQFVVFASSANNLAQAPTNLGGCGDLDVGIHVYRKRRGFPDLLCLSRTNPAGDGVSSNPAINHDGDKVVFQSDSTNLGCGGGLTHIYLATISGNAASLTCLTAGFGASSFNPAISANGNAVAYETLAVSPPGSTGCTGGQSKIVHHDLATGTKTCLASGQNGPSVNPAMSGDGSFVAFQTLDPTVATGCGGGNSGIVRRLVGGAATCVTPNGNGASITPDISDDGLTIALASLAINFDAACSTGGFQQIYIWRFPGPPLCFSRTSPGGLPGDGPSREPVLSGDGLFVAFTTQAGNLFPALGGSSPASARAAGARATTDLSQVMRRNTNVATSIATLMSSGVNGMGNGNSRNASLDFSGQVAVFQTSSTNLAPGDSNGTDDIVASTEIPPPVPARVAILSPATGAQFPLTGATPITVVWTQLGTSTYGFEFSCPDRQFSNPNASVPDPANGFGSACGGGGFPVGANFFSTTLFPGSIPAGTYNVRVIPLILGGTFSDAIAITLGQVNAAGNPTPIITAPANGVAAPIGGQVGFAWTAVIGAPQYLFSFSGPISGSFPLATTTFAAAVPAIPPGAYQITITALNAAGQPLGPASTPVTVNVQ